MTTLLVHPREALLESENRPRGLGNEFLSTAARKSEFVTSDGAAVVVAGRSPLVHWRIIILGAGQSH